MPTPDDVPTQPSPLSSVPPSGPASPKPDRNETVSNVIDALGDLGVDAVLRLCADACDIESETPVLGVSSEQGEQNAQEWLDLASHIRELADDAHDLYAYGDPTADTEPPGPGEPEAPKTT